MLTLLRHFLFSTPVCGCVGVCRCVWVCVVGVWMCVRAPKTVSAPTPRTSSHSEWLYLCYQTDLLPHAAVDSPGLGICHTSGSACIYSESGTNKVYQNPGWHCPPWRQNSQVQGTSCSICLPLGAEQSLASPIRPHSYFLWGAGA